MTTPIERGEHVYTATIWQHLDNMLQRDPKVRQEIIEHIAAEIEQAVAGQWISVAERLPEEGVIVLVFYPDVPPHWIQVDMLRRRNGEWMTGDMIMRETVTHWMPLPAPPKAEDTAHD